uniref:CMP/dCMP-type deaminase domain-containing protein n=1 Tax=viral metagenome TaxID=1070528 RepID=A0A6C0KJN1_9ZZZZ
MEKPEKILMKMASQLALQNVVEGGGPFGCVIADANDYIVGQGCNRVTLDNDPTAHAEMVAIRNACKKLGTFSLQGHTLYTSCEPCPMCLSAIYWSRVDRVYYGNTRKDAKDIGFDDDFIYDEVAKPLGHRKIPITQCGEDYAKKAFVLWENTDNKTPY